MEQSPLTHQPRPEVFQPKIVRLYEALFQQDDEDGQDDKSDGFWAEFFLHRPDRAALRCLLDAIPPDELLQSDLRTRQLFSRAVAALKPASAGGGGGGGGVADLHALDTLSTFFVAVLGKKYTNPSSDMIAVLAGLDRIDNVFADFVGALDAIIKNGRSLELREKAVERDLFPSVMKLIQDADLASVIVPAFTLLGLLANYNKFEFQNPYQMRLNDFVNEGTILKIIRSTGFGCQVLRSEYVEVQDDIPQGWTLSNTLHKMGLGAIAPGALVPKKQVYDAETAKKMFAALPGEEAAVLLATYDFVHANKLFCFNLVNSRAEKGEEQPLAAFTSLTSYLLQHAHVSQRATLYAHLNLMVFRLLIEDPVLCKRLCSDDSKTAVRLCRQRQPHLPVVRGERILATAVMDTMLDGLNHNLRRRLDVGLYTLCVGILLRIISYMSRSRTRLPYHWNELFRSLLTLVRFLTTYAADLRGVSHVETLLDLVVNLVALGLSAGEAFLPTPAAYDDLFYKVVEAGDVLVKFQDTWGLANRPSNSIKTLVSVSTHYKEMLTSGGGGGGGGKAAAERRGGSNLTSLQVADVIKQGYESLSIQSKEGLDRWERFREADERMLLKKMARAAVVDVKALVVA
ncbi:hypothetical protein P8C59_008410 [Phyllachora maydis]|uniref:Armadillo-like helical domain-containing protein n=1 Tax=Phyllachora maydis TaxID=1825666 RepID=A0AAD9IAN8_9PEZI|nr:hypothetical protein P8C59_008410 [Phyllachora maydis]